MDCILIDFVSGVYETVLGSVLPLGGASFPLHYVREVKISVSESRHLDGGEHFELGVVWPGAYRWGP